MRCGCFCSFWILIFSVSQTIAITNAPVLSENTTNVIYNGTYSRLAKGVSPYEYLTLYQIATKTRFYFSRELLSATNASFLGTWYRGNNKYWPCGSSGAPYLLTHDLTLREDGTVSYSAFLWTNKDHVLRLNRKIDGTFVVASKTQFIVSVSSPLVCNITDFSICTQALDPQKDAKPFDFIPSPATCRLSLVTSNMLVWIKYDADSTVYFQYRLDQKPCQILIFCNQLLPNITGLLNDGSLVFRLFEKEFVVSKEGRIRDFLQEHCLRDIRTICPFKIYRPFSPALFKQQLQSSQKSGKPISGTLSISSNKSENTKAISVSAVPNPSDPFWNDILNTEKWVSPEWLDSLWPIAYSDDLGFVLWNGEMWIECEEK